LVISESELRGGCCPECQAEAGERHYDFEALVVPEDEATQYRCEQCGALIEWKG
jgi:hypothetical protein